MVEDNNNASEILGRWCSSRLKVKKHHHHHHQHHHHMCSGALISATTEVCKWCFWAPHHPCPPSAAILHVLRYALVCTHEHSIPWILLLLFLGFSVLRFSFSFFFGFGFFVLFFGSDKSHGDERHDTSLAFSHAFLCRWHNIHVWLRGRSATTITSNSLSAEEHW